MSNSISAQTAGQFQPIQDNSPEFKFDFWGVLNRRKWIVFLGLVAGTLLAALYYFQTPSKYQSKAAISIQPKDPNFVRLSQLSINPMFPDAAELLPTRHDKYLVQRELIKLCCENYDIYAKASYLPLSPDETIDTIQDNLEVLPDKEDPWLYKLRFTSLNATDSEQVLNCLVETYRGVLEKRFEKETTNMVGVLNENNLVFREKLMGIEKMIHELPNTDLVTQLDKFGHDIHNEAISVLGPRLNETKDQLTTIVNSRNRTLEAINLGKDAMIKEMWKLEQDKFFTIKDKKVDLARGNGHEWLQARITEAEIALAELQGRLGPSHPKVEIASQTLARYQAMYKERIAEDEQPIVQEEIDPETVLRYCVERFENQIDELQSRYEDDLKQLEYHNQAASNLAELRQKRVALEKDREYYRRLLDENTNRILEIDPSMNLKMEKVAQHGFNFDVQEQPKQGEMIWPILPIVLVVGGLLGSLMGFGLGCLVDLADKTFHNPDEVIRSLGLPLIGHIPVISQGKRYQLENTLIEPVVCTYHRPKSQVSEAFRAVRTALYFNAQGGTNTVIQVTSPTPGDGKSTAAANLAVSIAQSGKRVLLVDGDMRRPRIGQIFGLTSKEGFATVLSGESFWKDVIFECAEIEGLSIMPCGLKPSNPAELATSPQVKQLMEQMRAEYDFVIIDTPPLLAVTDPCPIAARVDGVVLCMRIKKNVRISAERSVEILRNLGANIVGVVVNGVGAQSGYGSQYTYGAYRAGYSYNGYGYGYGYGYGNYYDEKNGQSTARPGTAAPPRRIEATTKDDQPIGY